MSPSLLHVQVQLLHFSGVEEEPHRWPSMCTHVWIPKFTHALDNLFLPFL